MNYKFDIVLKYNGNFMLCHGGMGNGDRCHAVVQDFLWMNKREIQWDQTNCSRKNQPSEEGEHKLYFLSMYVIND